MGAGANRVIARARKSLAVTDYLRQLFVKSWRRVICSSCDPVVEKLRGDFGITQSAAKTTEGPAGIVALEQFFTKGARLIDDELILRIAPSGIRFQVWLWSPTWMRNGIFRLYERLIPGVWAIFCCRKRFIEDKAQDAVQAGVKAVVNLGAGLDTLVYRSPALQELPAWEVDQAVNVETKQAGLVRALRAVPERVTQVLTDLRSLAGI